MVAEAGKVAGEATGAKNSPGLYGIGSTRDVILATSVWDPEPSPMYAILSSLWVSLGETATREINSARYSLPVRVQMLLPSVLSTSFPLSLVSAWKNPSMAGADLLSRRVSGVNRPSSLWIEIIETVSC